MLSIRRETGEELLTIFSPSEEWSVYLQPDGAMTNALLGTPSDPVVWINAMDRQVERDEDGTYSSASTEHDAPGRSAAELYQ